MTMLVATSCCRSQRTIFLLPAVVGCCWQLVATKSSCKSCCKKRRLSLLEIYEHQASLLAWLPGHLLCSLQRGHLSMQPLLQEDKTNQEVTATALATATTIHTDHKIQGVSFALGSHSNSARPSKESEHSTTLGGRCPWAGPLDADLEFACCFVHQSLQ